SLRRANAPEATARAKTARAASRSFAPTSTINAPRIISPTVLRAPKTAKAAPKEPPLPSLAARECEPERDQNVNVELGVGIGGGAFGAAAGFFAAALRLPPAFLGAAFFFLEAFLA